MADEIDLTKTAKGVKESLDHLKSDVTEATRGLKPEWRNLLNNMKDFNAPLAKSIADIRETSKKTAFGMLSARKLLETTKILDEFSEKGGKLDPKSLEKLRDFTHDLKDFDLDEFTSAQAAITKAINENEELADSWNTLLYQAKANSEKIKKNDASIAEQKILLADATKENDKKAMHEARVMLEESNEERMKIQEELREETTNHIKEEQKKNIEGVKEETELRDKHNELLKGGMEDLSEGANSYSKDALDGIKHLTGGVVDITSYLDDAAAGWKAVTDVAAGVQKGAQKAFKWLNMIFSGAWLKTIKDWIKKTVVYTKLMKVIQKFRDFSFKRWIAGQWQNLKNWVMESKMMKLLNAARNFQFKAWIASQWANLKQTKLFTGMQNILNKMSWSAFTAWIATKWTEVTLMIRQTAQRIAVIAKEIVAWAARMIAKAIEIAVMLLPVLPIIAIAAAVLALAALLIWGGMQLYEKSELFRSIVDTVIGYFKDIVSIIGDIFGGFMDFFTGLFTGDFDLMFSGLSDIFGGLWDLILAPFRAISGFIKDTFGIDIGGWLTTMLRKWLPGWALNLLGMGGSEDTDAMQAGLVGEVEKADKKAGLKSAEESGLLESRLGREDIIDKSKIAGATEQELKAIIADNDISDEDRSLILDTLNQRQVEAGGPDVAAQIATAREEGLSGADLAERTAQIKAGEYKGGGDTANINNTSNVDAKTTNELTVSTTAREGDSTLSRLNPAGQKI